MTEVDIEKLLKKTIAPAKVRDSLVGSAYLSDGTLLLGDNDEELPVHKFPLMTASPVFLRLFKNDADPNHHIRIKGISKEAMIEICRFAYTEQIKLNTDNMLTLFKAAKGLQMKFLMEKILNFICEDGMNEETVFKILQANQSENNFSVTTKCFEYIETNYQKCLKSSDFLLLSPDAFRNILKTCKRIPQSAAKKAITIWSAQIENQDEDLDEFIALLPVNEEACACSSKPKHYGAYDQDVFDGIYTNMKRRQKEQSSEQAWFGNIFFDGKIARKNSQFSKLAMKTSCYRIAINVIHFVYDLSLTDLSFKIRISDLTNKKDLFNATVDINKQGRPFFSYVLPLQVLPFNSNICISIDFGKSQDRISLGNTSMKFDSNYINLVGEQSDSAQIIDSINFVKW